MNETVEVRPVVPGDRDELLRLRLLLWPDSTAEEVDALIDSSPDAYAVLVANRPDGSLCGFAEIGLRPFAEGCSGSPVGYLEGIWVDPDMRRSGVGRRLVDAGNRWGVSRGCADFASDCEENNTASRAFHRSVGFGEVAQTVCFRRSAENGRP